MEDEDVAHIPSLNVKELRVRLKNHRLSTVGKKSELIMRLSTFLGNSGLTNVSSHSSLGSLVSTTPQRDAKEETTPRRGSKKRKAAPESNPKARETKRRTKASMKEASEENEQVDDHDEEMKTFLSEDGAEERLDRTFDADERRRSQAEDTAPETPMETVLTDDRPSGSAKNRKKATPNKRLTTSAKKSAAATVVANETFDVVAPKSDKRPTEPSNEKQTPQPAVIKPPRALKKVDNNKRAEITNGRSERLKAAHKKLFNQQKFVATIFSSEESLQSQRSTSTSNTTSSANGDASPGTGRLLVQPGLTLAQTTRTLMLKRKFFDNDKEAIRAATMAISQEERADLDDLENFARVFKEQRIKFGFTQGDVGLALGKRYGADFAQTTISRFEALNLSFKNMCKLRPFLEKWLCETEFAVAAGASPSDVLHRSPSPSVSVQAMSAEGDTGGVAGGDGALMSVRKRSRRTNLDCRQRTQLEEEFQQDAHPDQDKMEEISNRLELHRDVIRAWFTNRRQKVRRLEEERLTLASAVAARSGPPLHLPSKSEGKNSPD